MADVQSAYIRGDPYALDEVRRLRAELARSRAVIEAIKTLVPREISDQSIHAGNLRLDSRTMQLWINGVAVRLPALKFHILLSLSQDYGAVVPAARLLRRSHHQYRDAPNLAAAHICQLRKFMARHSADVEILTVHGAGYRLAVKNS